jgi:hypothetical protein
MPGKCGWHISRCNYLQNVGATTYKKLLQLSTKRSCKKQIFSITKLFFKTNVNGNVLLQSINRSVQTRIYTIWGMVVSVFFALFFPVVILPILLFGLLSEIIMIFTLFSIYNNKSGNKAFYLTILYFMIQGGIFAFLIYYIIKYFIGVLF